MPDKQSLPELSNEIFDGEKYSVEVKDTKCNHELILIDPTHVKCAKCTVGWEGPQIGRLYEAYRQSHKKT